MTETAKNQKNTEIEKENGSCSETIASFFSHLISIPLFIILHKLIPDPDWVFHSDRILLFIATIGVVEIIIQGMKGLVTFAMVVALVWLTYGSIWGSYGFADVYKDYKYMIYAMIDSPHPEDIILDKFKYFPNESEIKKAIDIENHAVRNFALSATTKHFQEFNDDSEFSTLIHCLAVFKEINGNWNYVSDPKSREYFAKASESIMHLSGDCDDHAILMAACIWFVGGEPMLIHTTGHLYPLVKIGNKGEIEKVNYLINRQLFKQESAGAKIHYYIDEHGDAWLNLDYTADYPGGKFMSEEVLGSLIIR